LRKTFHIDLELFSCGYRFQPVSVDSTVNKDLI